MGGSFNFLASVSSDIYPNLNPNPKPKVLMIGLDNSGKTTLMYRYVDPMRTIPTIGFQFERFSYKDMDITIMDYERRFARALVDSYIQTCDGIVFVLDFSDQDENMLEAKTALWEVINSSEKSNLPLLVIANKADRSTSNSIDNLIKILDLRQLKKRLWFVQEASTFMPKRIDDGLDWLGLQICCSK